MVSPQKVISFQISQIKAHTVTFGLVVLSGIGALYVGYAHNKMNEAIPYLFVMWLCSFIVDLFTLGNIREDFEVRKPLSESVIVITSIVLSFIGLYLRLFLFSDWAHATGILKLLTIILMLLCVFPIGLAISLLVMKYRPRALGIRWQGFLTVIPIIAISAIANVLISADKLTWNEIIAEEGGIVATLLTGVITAGLSEEFFRFVGMTRLGSLFHNRGLAWFLVTIVWASMHIPKWASDGGDMSEAILGAIRIVPIGLMWGYITQRTKSILPATLVHGTNFWGLQNF